MNRPYILIKVAVSLDGCIDDRIDRRLILSNLEDQEAVDALKSTFDAILVGAETIRKDNPSLLIKSELHQSERLKKGMSQHPCKVTLTCSGDLDPMSRFFQDDGTKKWIYCPQFLEKSLQKKFSYLAQVVGLPGDIPRLVDLISDLKNRGISRLMVEGGAWIQRLFLQSGCVDAMRIAIAPIFVGDRDAPRLASSRIIRMKLKQMENLGDRVILHYELPVEPRSRLCEE